MKDVLIIGAGKTGRGFIPQYLSHVHLYFADKNHNLVQKMKLSYKIKYYGSQKVLEVSYQDVFHVNDNEFYEIIKKVDYIFISIDVSHYKELAIELNKSLVDRKKSLVFVTFEYAISASSIIKPHLSEYIKCPIIFLDAGVFCTTNQDQGIDIKSQDLCYLPIQYQEGIELPLSPIIPIQNFSGLMKRKLYTYNCLSAVISYQGYVKGYDKLGEAAHDHEIMTEIEILLSELNLRIAESFGISKQEQDSFSQSAIDKFSDVDLEDSIERNARNVLRKLGNHERLIQPLLLVKEKKTKDVLLKTIACACLYDFNEETHQGIEFINRLPLNEEEKLRMISFYNRIATIC